MPCCVPLLSSVTLLCPSVPQSMIQGDLEVLKDWCYEAVSAILRTT